MTGTEITDLTTLLAARKTAVASVAETGQGSTARTATCPICGGAGEAVLRIEDLESAVWAIVTCPSCGPDQGGVAPAGNGGVDLVPGEVGQSSMLDQGAEDRRWEDTEARLADLDPEAAEKVVAAALREIEGDVALRIAGSGEWIGGGLGSHAAAFHEAEVFSDWPERDRWEVLAVLDAGRLGGVPGEACVAVINRAAERGVWCIL